MSIIFEYDSSELMLFQNRDVWETRWCQQVCGSLTWHVFDNGPPSKVYVRLFSEKGDIITHRCQLGRLDLGCGTGTWILEAAKEWKVCNLCVQSLSTC